MTQYKTLLIHTEEVPPLFHFDPLKPTRGTEKFYVETANAAKQLGFNEVFVVMDGLERGVLRSDQGVIYWPRHHLDLLGSPTLDLICNPRRRLEYKGIHQIVWTNFYFPKEVYPQWFWTMFSPNQAVDEVICISEYAKGLMSHLTAPTRVVGHGVDPKVYHPGTQPREKIIAYTSSPDRGLETLKQIQLPDGWRLETTRYGDPTFADQDVADLLRKASYWAHPGEGVELYCLAAVEAQSCGAVPLVVPTGALSETVTTGHRFASTAEMARFIRQLTEMPEPVKFQHPTWLDVTRDLLRDYL